MILCSRITGKKDAEKIIKDPWVYSRISDDASPTSENFTVPEEGVTYIGGYGNGRIISLYVVHHSERMHFMVLKEFRRHADILFEQAFKMLRRSAEVRIPECYTSVINFALHREFHPVGVEYGFRKGGVELPLIVMRREWSHGICI